MQLNDSFGRDAIARAVQLASKSPDNQMKDVTP